MLFNIPAGAKQSVLVSVYGAATETVTLTAENGTTYTVTTDANGYGGELEMGFGSYTVAGSVSGYSGSVTVDKRTTMVNAWPADQVIFFWHGATPNGAWTKEGFSEGHNWGATSIAEIVNGEIRVSANTNYTGATFGTTYVYDLTNIDELHFELTACSHASYVDMGVTQTPGDVKSTGLKTAPKTTGASIATLDVSGLSGEYYIYVDAWRYNYNYANGQFSRIWGTVDPEGTIRSTKQEIAIGNTYRYANSLIAGDWVKVSSLSFGSINYVGQGTEDYNAMMVPVKAFNYSGSFERLRLALYLWTSNRSNHTFRWAVTTSTANAQAYKVGAGDVVDEYQLGQGAWTPPYSDAFQWFTIDLDVENIPSGTPFYVYLWRDNTTYGNIHVTGSAVVTLDYAKQ